MRKALKEYVNKRDFKQTAEPAAKSSSSKKDKKLVFVVQRHDATRLHYDFRLELNGTLKSWAVPKGPSLNPTDKRLAVMVEDHPFDYRNFYGSIPEGNYGAGEVEIWDEGFYFPIDENHEQISAAQATKNIEKGELKILLAGSHLNGEYVLVRLKKDDKNWLLIKHDDEYAVHKKFNIEKIASIRKKDESDSQPAEKDKAASPKKAAKKAAVKNTPTKKSATKKTATTKKEPVKSSGAKKTAAKSAKSSGKKKLEPLKPMLAYTASEPFDDQDWIYEYKWDGYRVITTRQDDDVNLISRNGISYNTKFAAITQAVSESVHHDVILDGEIVALVKGKHSFQALQHADANSDLRYYIFDLLSLDGNSLLDFPLTDRKQLLEQLLENSNHDFLIYSSFIKEKGKGFYAKAKKAGYEGIMAKKADSVYMPGARTRDWLKIKVENDREAIIAGYTEGKGSRKFFGALVLAEKVGKGYRYIGHTGTGFDDALLKSLHATMQPLITNKSPFDGPVKVNGKVTWIKPTLVCTIKFTEQTTDGMLRHPVFVGLRNDKTAKEVRNIKEEIIDPEILKKEEDMEAVAEGKQELTIDKKKIPVSNLDKIYFPEKKITKGDVIAYYHSVASYILPHLKDRPLSLKRNPNGIHGESFYHKNAGENAPSWLKTYEDFSESSNRTIEYLVCNDAATLVYLANLGCIEMNPWNATIKKPDHPTWMVIDLDPSDKNTFEEVIETANAVKEVLDKAAITSYCKTSGASGLHIYVPFKGKYDYDTVRTFAEVVARTTHDMLPEFTSVERNLKKRGHKIYVDYLQNRSNQTLASVYSVRPVEAASVSMPVDWKDVKKGLHPTDFTIFNVPDLLKKQGDAFADVLKGTNDLKKAMKLLSA